MTTKLHDLMLPLVETKAELVRLREEYRAFEPDERRADLRLLKHMADKFSHENGYMNYGVWTVYRSMDDWDVNTAEGLKKIVCDVESRFAYFNQQIDNDVDKVQGEAEAALEELKQGVTDVKVGVPKLQLSVWGAIDYVEAKLQAVLGRPSLMWMEHIAARDALAKLEDVKSTMGFYDSFHKHSSKRARVA
jgi:hypothetical protein